MSIAEKATVRRRNTDQLAQKYMLAMICILLFSMIFVFVAITNKDEQLSVAIMDNTGVLHKGEVVPFGNAKAYHEYLLNMAVDGIYERDGEGVLNNYFQFIATPNAINKRKKLISFDALVFKQKKIIQTSRIIEFKVDKITNLRMDMKAQVQIIRKSYSLGGEQIEGKDMRVLTLRFEKNENIKEGIYRPWVLADFKEWREGKNDA